MPVRKKKSGSAMPTGQKPKSKHWCFTINNWTIADGKSIEDAKSTMQYIVCGREIGEDGTPHMQGYVVFLNRKRLTAVKKIFPRAHLEMKSKRSTYAECITYCKKDGDFLEHGVAPISNSERQKRKWEDAFELAKAQKINEIEKGMLIRYYHAFKRIAQDNPPVPADLTAKKNYWFLAPSQYGKSTYVRKKFGPKSNLYDKGPNKWWIGYKGEKNILCDDFGPKQCQYLGWYMKRWADLFSFPMETKGGGTQIRPARIIVTSQYTIAECFTDEKECEAVSNRFKVVNLPHWRNRINFDVQ